jgi:glycosyltransferase involved in cell wall biosynthesis
MSMNLKICIISEYANSLFDKDKVEAGGAEIQMTFLAKELRKRSYDVSLIAFGSTDKSFKITDKIKLYNPFDIKGYGYIYLHPYNIYKLFKTLNIIDADVYIQRAATPLTGFISFFSKLKNKKFIYSVSSEADVSETLEINSFNDFKKLFFKFGVKYCDCVVCQTNHQIKLLNQKYNKKTKLIKNFYYLSNNEKRINPDSKLIVIWVGRIVKEKRPELFLKLAKYFPMITFTMIGGCSGDKKEYFDQIKQSASKIKNLEFLGYIQYDKMDTYYKQAILLVSTSQIEGFPNTFIEAWGNGIPVVSLGFDPDEIICNNQLGLHSETFEQLKHDIKTLLENKKLRNKMGSNSRKYIEKEHNINKILEEYEKLIKSLVEVKILV